MLAYLASIEQLPLAVAVFIGKIHPLAAAAFSAAFLGEPLRPARVGAILASLGGIALIARPAPGETGWDALPGVLLGLLGGVLSGAAYCCVRALNRGGESELWLLLALPLFSLPFSAPSVVAALDGAGAPREAAVWCGLFALGLATQGGQIALNRGLARLPAASGTQAMYFGTLSGVLFGVAVGDGWPPPLFWVGGAIILGALQCAEVADRRAEEVEARTKESDLSGPSCSPAAPLTPCT